MKTIRPQDANWDTVRAFSAFITSTATQRPEVGEKHNLESARLESNGIVLRFLDGSEITYRPEITKNADKEEVTT